MESGYSFKKSTSLFLIFLPRLPKYHAVARIPYPVLEQEYEHGIQGQGNPSQREERPQGKGQGETAYMV